MPWSLDRGRNGIICYACRGKGRMLALHVATGVQQIVPCQDCGGEGFVKHCIGCQGTGRVDNGENAIVDCPECSGKGYPLPKRILIPTNGLRRE